MSSAEISPPDSFDSDRIVDAALDLVCRQGLAGLTLRPLAVHAGLSVAVISARLGTKDQIVEQVIDRAAQHDRAFFDRWLALSPHVGSADSAARAALTDLAFREWIVSRRPEVIFLIELIHDRALQPTASPALDRWLESAGAFWSTLVFGCADHADLALGYVIDEASFALGAGDDPLYSLLRVLCLKRFADGLFADAGASGSAIPLLVTALESSERQVAVVDDPKRRRIADGAAEIIVSRGIEAVTHRSVATAAGVPASTVVYHFGARPALVVAGLNAVIARFHDMLDEAPAAYAAAEEDAETRNVTKATAMIALASVREPSLLPHAIEMRRRRGDRIQTDDLAGLGFRTVAGFDRAAAQVVALAVYGMRMVAMARNLPERAHYRAAFAAIEAWAAARR